MITFTLFLRWWNQTLWTKFFTEFLNIPNASTLPDLDKWIAEFQQFFFKGKLKTWSEVRGALSIALRK